MGTLPVMKRIATKPMTIAEKIEAFAYRAPYSYVINTQDGSGGEWFMENALRSETPRTTFINGVSWNVESLEEHSAVKDVSDLGRQKPIIMFVGRMEKIKGCDEFLEVVLSLASQNPDSFLAVMIGNGERLNTLQNKVRQAGMESTVQLIPQVLHREIQSWLQIADIYVSLNKTGSLSNANLEAMQNGKCIIILKSDRKNHIDEITDRLFPSESLYRIKRKGLVPNLKKALIYLLANPDERARRGKLIKELAQKLIPTWEDRIQTEINILREIVNSKSNK